MDNLKKHKVKDVKGQDRYQQRKRRISQLMPHQNDSSNNPPLLQFSEFGETAPLNSESGGPQVGIYSSIYGAQNMNISESQTPFNNNTPTIGKGTIPTTVNNSIIKKNQSVAKWIEEIVDERI